METSLSQIFFERINTHCTSNSMAFFDLVPGFLKTHRKHEVGRDCRLFPR
jgi:hypothetical protein